MFAAIAIIIVAIVLAVALSAQQSPRSQGPQKGTVPDVKDGKRVIRVYGTVWIDDPIQLAMKQTDTTPIRK